MLTAANPYRLRICEFPGRLIYAAKRSAMAEFITAAISADSSLVIELCSGSGGNLLSLAVLHPEAACIGLELRYKRAVRTIEKAQQRGLDNVFVFQADVKMISELFPPASVDEIHLHFPEPWKKKRHAKHRVVSASLLETVALLLKPGSYFYFRSDDPVTVAVCHELFVAGKEFETFLFCEDYLKTPTELPPPHYSKLPETEFEKLFKHLQKKIGLLVVRKL